MAILFLSFSPLSIYFSLSLFRKFILFPAFSPLIFNLRTEVSLLIGFIDTDSM
jgi:hypothetical protein